jgi:uncharacterized SAM-binding protein YcdF (DUF218 family)
MTFLFSLKSLLGSLLLPPGNGLFLLGLALAFRRRRWAFSMALVGGLLLLAQSLPIVSGELMGSLERRAGRLAQGPDGALAIVVLGSGLITAAPEFGGEFATYRTLIRVRHGAQLAGRWGLPVLVTGGKPLDAERSEAAVMAEMLSGEFGVPVRWQEDQSVDTAGNARLSAAILHPAGIRRIALVTQAFHMPRAAALFEAAGFEVVRAPTHFVATSDGPPVFSDFVPRASALHNSYYALHEWLGILWMQLSGR